MSTCVKEEILGCPVSRVLDVVGRDVVFSPVIHFKRLNNLTHNVRESFLLK